jgi:hypothetical protein
MITIIDTGEEFGDVIYKEESIGIKEPGNIIRFSFTLECCMNDEKSFDEIIQYRSKLPEIRQAAINLGYKIEKEDACDLDIDQESIEDLRSQYNDCF